MTEAIESGVGGVWQIKQAAAGVVEPVGSIYRQLKKAGDDKLKAAKTYGSEEYVDGKRFGSPSMFVDTIGGDVGNITAQAQIETAGFIFAQTIGVDVVTGVGPDFTHTIASGSVQSVLQTIRQKVGVAVGPWRQSFFDAKVNKLTWNASQEDKVAHLEQNIFAMKAASWATADPAATIAASDPFNWNEVEGETKINGVSFPEIDGDTLELDSKLDVHRGDSAKPICFVYGKGEVMRSMSALVTDDTIPEIKTILYGTPTPADGDPVSTTVGYVALESTYTRSAVRSLKISTPKVAANPEDFEVGPQAEGGKIPVTFGGRCLEDGATALVTVVAKTEDGSSYLT